MKTDIVCCICSREKAEDSNKLPARERYLGSHVKIAEAAAKKDNFPFYILSGKYGLVEANEPIYFYDHLLQGIEVAQLVSRLCMQFARLPIEVEQVLFYTKVKKTWQPYNDALRLAAEKIKIRLQIIELADDA